MVYYYLISGKMEHPHLHHQPPQETGSINMSSSLTVIQVQPPAQPVQLHHHQMVNGDGIMKCFQTLQARAQPVQVPPQVQQVVIGSTNDQENINTIIKHIVYYPKLDIFFC